MLKHKITSVLMFAIGVFIFKYMEVVEGDDLYPASSLGAMTWVDWSAVGFILGGISYLGVVLIIKKLWSQD